MVGCIIRASRKSLEVVNEDVLSSGILFGMHFDYAILMPLDPIHCSSIEFRERLERTFRGCLAYNEHDVLLQ